GEIFSLEPEPKGGTPEEIPPLELEAPYEALPTAIGKVAEPDVPRPQPPAAPEAPAAAPAARKAAKGDYTTEVPSIAADRPREAVVLPPVPREIPRGKQARRKSFDISRI